MSKRKVSLSALHRKLGLASARPATSPLPQTLPQQLPGLIGLLPSPTPEQTTPTFHPPAPKVEAEGKAVQTAPQKRLRQEIDLNTLPESKDVMTP